MTRLIIALDVESKEKALELVDVIGGECDFYKIGPKLFCRYGIDIVRELKKRGKKIFLDLKLHDIPKVVSDTVKFFEEEGVDLLTLHCAGGIDMLTSARYGREGDLPLLFGVTVLSSLTDDFIEEMFARPPSDAVFYFADMAKKAGLDGIVVPPFSLKALSESYKGKLLLLSAGIRLDKRKDDHATVLTPSEARHCGADFIVVGRPIYQANNPKEVVKKIIKELRR